jgi:hypothetical protein
MSAAASRQVPWARAGAIVLLLVLPGVAVVGVSGCKLFGGKTAPTAEPKRPGPWKGKVTLGQTEQPSEASQPPQSAEREKARLTVKPALGSSPIQGAAFKVLDETGMVVQRGQVPRTVRLSANTRYRVAVTKPGFKPWKAWQTLGGAGTVTEVVVALEPLKPPRVRVKVCATSGRLATPYCPRTKEKDVPACGPPVPCTVHGSRRAEVQVTLCTVSGKRATRYCPRTATRRLPQGEVPGCCTVHRAP